MLDLDRALRAPHIKTCQQRASLSPFPVTSLSSLCGNLAVMLGDAANLMSAACYLLHKEVAHRLTLAEAEPPSADTGSVHPPLALVVNGLWLTC